MGASNIAKNGTLAIMNTFAALKHFHLLMVALTGLIFLWRGVLLLNDSPRLNSKPLRILPHVIYTLLLVSGLALAHQVGMQAWIWTKLILLFAFVVVGVLVFKRAQSPAARLAGLALALLIYAYIGSVAMTHNPAGWFS